MTMLDKLIPISRRVDYGPFRGVGDHKFFWGCNPCLNEEGGYPDSLDAARRKAEEHAKAHRGARAVYYEG